MGIHKKLLEIQKEVDKLQKNASGYNFSYTDGEVVLDKIRPLMNEKGLLCYPSMINNRTEQIFYKNKYDKEIREFLYQADGKFTWVDIESDEILEVDWTFSGNNDDASQAQGNALTYNERYFLLKFFKIATTKDDPDAKKPSEKGKGKATKGQVDKLRAMTSNYTAEDVMKALKRYKVGDFSDLTPEQANQIIKKLEG